MSAAQIVAWATYIAAMRWVRTANITQGLWEHSVALKQLREFASAD